MAFRRKTAQQAGSFQMNTILFSLLLLLAPEPRHTWEDPIFDQPITNQAFDPSLLQEALFHATNSVRQKNKRNQLDYQQPLEEAAATHSIAMAKRFKLDHKEKDKLRKDPSLRVQQAGGVFELVGENILYLPLPNFGNDQPRYVVEEGTVLSPNGLPIPLHTYRSWAELALEEWMKSPGHKQNILEVAYLYLGTGVSSIVYHKDLPYLYATQVFAGN